MIEWSLRRLLAEPRIQGVVVALAADDRHWPAIAAKLNNAKLHSTLGGVDRQSSVMSGLSFWSAQAAADDFVLVHDAARPCLSGEDLRAVLDASEPAGAVLGAPVVDTVKRERVERVETVDRNGLWRALTPQIFVFAALRRALEAAAASGAAITDEAQAMELQGFRPTMVSGSPFNIKVTLAEDLKLAASIIRLTENDLMRVGQGFDVHAFGEGHHVVLGGVTIAYPKGIVAHSDGDVVIHALCDAILGAMGEGDIGQHFPDSDPRYRGADSRVFLREIAARMREAGLSLVNADVTVLAEAPRIGPHRLAMAQNLAADLNTTAKLINIKATTTERLGFVGRGEGLAALASVLLGP